MIIKKNKMRKQRPKDKRKLCEKYAETRVGIAVV